MSPKEEAAEHQQKQNKTKMKRKKKTFIYSLRESYLSGPDLRTEDTVVNKFPALLGFFSSVRRQKHKHVDSIDNHGSKCYGNEYSRWIESVAEAFNCSLDFILLFIF